MNTKCETTEAVRHEHRRPRFMYFVAGIGIGAAVSFFFTPKSGEQTRKWLAKKAFDAFDDANEKVWQTRAQVKEIIDRRQQQVGEMVAVARDKAGVPKVSIPVSTAN